MKNLMAAAVGILFFTLISPVMAACPAGWTGLGTCETAGTASLANIGTSGGNVPVLNTNNTWSGVQSFNSGDFKLNGSSSGNITVNAAAAASGVITVPAATDTLVGRATTDTLTNKTLTSPILVTPALGTPSSGTLTNATGLPVSSGISGLGTGIATWLATPSSANLLAALTTKTGTGSAVFGTSPTISAPTITGVPVLSGLSSGTQVSCLGLDASNNVVLNAAACGSGGGGGSAFNALTGGTNTTAAMLVGTGASLGPTGSGAIDSTTLLTKTWASPAAIGTGTPAGGAFTTLSASSTVSGTGFSTYLASPPAIGGTAAAAGTFSSLKDTGVTGSTQCLHADTSGAITGTGSDCGSGGASLTVTDGTHSVASTTTLTFGTGYVVGGSAGSATLNSSAPNRSSGTAITFTSADFTGQVNSTGTTNTATIPANTTLGANQSILLTNQGSGVVTLTNSQTVNGLGLATKLHSFGFYVYTGNGTSADAFGFPGYDTITAGALAKFSDASGAFTAGDLSGVITTSGSLVTSLDTSAHAIPSAWTATTQAAKDNSTKLATTAYVDLPTALTAGSSVTLTAPRQYFVCTTTCTVTVPVPAAGDEFCVLNDDNVTTVITLAAIGSSARYENTARTAYGTAGTGTLVSGGAAADKVCILGRDSTHYLTVSFNGTWTAN